MPDLLLSEGTEEGARQWQAYIDNCISAELPKDMRDVVAHVDPVANVTRKVSMRVSIIDEKTLKEIDKRRQGLRILLTKFTFALADNIRWMPITARKLFESEVNRVNEEGQKLVSDLLGGDIDAFIDAKRDALVADINGMHAELGRSGKVTDRVINEVDKDLKDRLRKVQSVSFLPKLLPPRRG
jgi:hypothetical protein